MGCWLNNKVNSEANGMKGSCICTMSNLRAITDLILWWTQGLRESLVLVLAIGILIEGPREWNWTSSKWNGFEEGPINPTLCPFVVRNFARLMM